MLKTLESLFELARSRKNNPVSDSYTNKLLSDTIMEDEKNDHSEKENILSS